MRSGTTANWTSGTGEIAKLQRTPYFHVDCDFYGSTVTEVDSGSLYHDDFTGTDWPAWLGTAQAGAGAVTRGGGTACFTGTVLERAYAITASSVGSPAPNSGKFIVRTRTTAPGSSDTLYALDNWSYGSVPIPIGGYDYGNDPSVYYTGGSIFRVDADANVGSSHTIGNDYIAEAAYDGTNAYVVVRTANMGTILWGSHAHVFETGSSYYGLLGDSSNTAHLGTLYAKYFQLVKGTTVSVGNLGSGYVMQLYGSDDVVVGSGQSSAQNGTVTLDISAKEYPLLGYFRVFTGTDQGSQITRHPDTSNGSFWGGGVYKVGTGDPDINDISDDVSSLRYRVEYEDALTGYVPSGAISGDCDIELATGSKYSYFNRSAPYYGIARLNRDVKVDTGFDVSGTSQYLSAFTGLTSEFQTSAEGRDAQLKCLDRSELLRRKSITWELMHNVRSDDVIRAVLAECGIFCFPAVDFWCKFDNSTTSEQGHTASTWIASGSSAVAYETGRWGEANGALAPGASTDPNFLYVHYRNLAMTDVLRKGYISFWSNNVFAPSIYLYANARNSLRVLLPSILGDNYQVVKTSAGSASTLIDVDDLTVAPGYGWNHVCVTWDYDMANLIKAYWNGTLVGSATLGTYESWDMSSLYFELFKDATNTGAIDQLMYGGQYLSDDLVTGMYLADATDSNTIDTGLNTVEWLWLQEKDAWNLVKEICEAEGAKFWFDADGDAHFANRHSLMNDNQISVKTISHDDELVRFNLREDADAVINRAIVRSSPLRKQNGTEVFAANELIEVPAPRFTGSALSAAGTRTIYVWFDNPVTGLDTTITGTAGTGQSKFSAFHYLGIGQGSRNYMSVTGSVALTATAYSAGARIHISSSAGISFPYTPYAVPYACSIGSAPGDFSTEPSYTDCVPYLYLWGSSVIPNVYTGSRVAEFYAVAEDSDSQSTYGTKSIEVENSFIQDLKYADDWAKWVVMNNAQPKPRLDDVTIMADPRLEAGDRVTALDDSGNTGLQDDFWVLGIDNDYGPPWTQTLKLDYASGTARVSQAPILILDHPIQGMLDFNCPAF